jgi:hypothetical protein
MAYLKVKRERTKEQEGGGYYNDLPDETRL